VPSVPPAAPPQQYTVEYTRDEDGWVFADVVELPGCHTQGRTREQARERIREALAGWVEEDVAATCELREVVGPGVDG
jgi:predicted RNase H-like HicB family nuclease